MDTYKEIETKLHNLEPFRGNSLHAIKNLDSNTLEVYSYSTLIATAHAPSSAKRVYWLAQSKYSVTTSRHQNLIRRAWGL